MPSSLLITIILKLKKLDMMLIMVIKGIVVHQQIYDNFVLYVLISKNI